MGNNKSQAGAVISDTAEEVAAVATAATTMFGLPLAKATSEGQSNASAAGNFDGGNKTFNILKDYVWTLSQHKSREDLPLIKLSEHRNTESAIMRSLIFYGKGILGSAEDLGGKENSLVADALKGLQSYTGGGRTTKGILGAYEDIFPDQPTTLKYVFPYFAKQYMELNTPNWTQPDSAASELGGASKAISDVTGKFDSLKGFSKALDVVNAGAGALGAIGETALKANYPSVGVIDRPRVFATHSERAVTIEFPLYNTKNHDDWIQNVNFLNVFMTQNLFNKRDFITGYPPCYYRVLIPGQYFCFASCVTNIAVENLGNVRMLKLDKTRIAVPDAYQVKIELTEMVIPSLNQFHAIFDGSADMKVQVGE